MKLIAIDPGDKYSGFVTLNENGTVLNFGKIDNNELLKYLTKKTIEKVIVEMIAGYGASKHVSETLIWIGRIIQHCELLTIPLERIYRVKVRGRFPTSKKKKRELGITLKTADVIIKRVLEKLYWDELVNNFGLERCETYFVDDVWQAYALGLTALGKNYDQVPIS